MENQDLPLNFLAALYAFREVDLGDEDAFYSSISYLCPMRME